MEIFYSMEIITGAAPSGTAPAFHLQFSCDKDIINCLDGSLKIRVFHTDDDVQFTGALVDHLHIDGSLTLVLSPHFKEPLINSLFWAYFFVKFFVFIRAILYYMWYNNLEVMIYVCCNQWCWQL